MLRTIKKIAGKILRISYRLGYRLIPGNKRMILFISFHGRGYSDNPKAIHEYITSHPEYKEYQCIWAIKHHRQKKLVIENTKVIEYFSLSYFYYLARSKYWIVNCKLPNYVLKKENQVYLQTWHGTPLKKLAHDISVSAPITFYRSKMTLEQMRNTYDEDVHKYTYMLSPSAFTTKVFRSAFQIEQNKLLETGYPRNDILSTYSTLDIHKIYTAYNLPRDKKIILYAPTWRDNSYTMQGYTFKLEVNFKMWREILGDEYIILFKPHYLIVNTFTVEGDFVYYIDPEKDIRDLYLISDILITDYSSVFFDFALLRRPIYFYMYDLVEYQTVLRGFYLDINKDLPGPIYTEEKKMLEQIKLGTFNSEVIDAFNQRFNTHEDGNASMRVVKAVLGR